jgi:glycosyltransferase involved in cell wall biosynthesis
VPAPRDLVVHAVDGEPSTGGGPGWAAALAGSLARHGSTALVVPGDPAAVELDPWIPTGAPRPTVRKVQPSRTRVDDLRRAWADRGDRATVVQSTHAPRLTASPRSAVLVDFPLGLLGGPADRWRLGRYRMVIANSRFTARWVAARWGRDAEVLPPLVLPLPPSTKDPILLSVGRFTGGSRTKGQLEMVEAFRRLGPEVHRRWSLHLAGYVADLAYLSAVRTAAAGLSVVLHPDAPRHEVEALYGRAAIYWHACGAGSDVEHEPERFEHFGIAVVEAMSAGAAPLVLAAGGPADTVAGVAPTWIELDDLVARTRDLIDAPSTRDGIGERARARALDFGPAAFDTRVDSLLTRLLGG